MNQQALIEKVAEAIFLADNRSGDWDDERPYYEKMARAALTAYAEATGERVVYTAVETTLFAKLVQGAPAGSSFFAQPGEEIVARKAGT